MPRWPSPDLLPADAEIIARHLDYMRLRGLAHTTIYHRQRDLIQLAGWLPVPLIDATDAHLARWRAGLTIGVGATLGLISSASQFYAWAANYERIRADNPAARLLRPRRPRRLPRPISETDLMAALAPAPPRIRLWLELAGWGGLRAKEIALLRREYVMDQAEPPALFIASDATKGITERLVPICAFLLAELIAADLPASGWLFLRKDGKPGPNAPHTISHLCNEYLHQCGIPATLHQLRHRFGTQAYRASHDLRAVQELMGHADPATTAGYAAYDLESAIAAINAMPVPADSAAVRLLGKVS